MKVAEVYHQPRVGWFVTFDSWPESSQQPRRGDVLIADGERYEIRGAESFGGRPPFALLLEGGTDEKRRLPAVGAASHIESAQPVFCNVCTVERLRLKPGEKFFCRACNKEQGAFRRAPDRTLCGTCKADVTDWYSRVDSDFETLPCGHSASPTNTGYATKLVEVTEC